MKIQQISSLTGRSAGLLEKMITLAPLFQYAEFRLDTSLYTNIPDKSSFANSAARAVNAALQRDAQAPAATALALALYGRELSIDDVYKLDQNITGSPAGLKLFTDRQLSALCIKLAEEVQYGMVSGSNAANQMLGLSTFVKDAAAGGQTAALGFTAAEQAAMNNQVSLKIDNDDDQRLFVELLMKEIAKVPGANALLCNVNLSARLTTIAKKHGAAGESVNTFGVPINTFNKVPIVGLPETVISQTESDGVNDDCTSLYIVRYAEELGVCHSTNSGFYFTDFEDAEVKPNGVSRMQFFINTTVERTDALRRESRIRL